MLQSERPHQIEYCFRTKKRHVPRQCFCRPHGTGPAGSFQRFFIEEIEKNQPETRADLIDWDISFMVFAEHLNCFYPFQKVPSCPPCPKGTPGLDFCELRGQNGGYILLIPEKKNSMENAFSHFYSIPATLNSHCLSRF